ncbi:MAG: PQQ-dependent sugar dehydrogenase [Gammaproteobacteria bacterium]|nr:PQQ-dependent sugar dehydrogenase [Gammaproteobacteria bacterium]
MNTINQLLSRLGLICLTVTVPVHAEKVETIFANQCASCHGENLAGAMAPSLLDDKWLTDGSDEALANAIKLGIKGTSMPAFTETLNDEQVRSLVVYIREARFKAASATRPATQLNKPINSQYHTLMIRNITNAEGVIWAMDFLPNGDLLYTLRQGELWRLSKDGVKTLIKNTPPVWHQRQGGLLDVYPDPNFAENGWVYLSFSQAAGRNKQGDEIAFTKIVRGKIENDSWLKQETLFEAKPENRNNRGWHFGSRIVIQGDYLFFSNGDEGQQELAQMLTNQNGKIHRIHRDGRIPKDNPFVEQAQAQHSAYTYGNRNPQGLAIDPVSGQLWATEHGPRGGDELNLIEKGVNYGWPKVTFGMNYNGTPITEHTELPGMRSPVHHWTPSIAVAGINFYLGDTFTKWRGDLLVGSLAKQQLHRLRLKDGQVLEEEVLLKGLGRIRDVVTAPNGDVYLTLNDSESGTSQIVALTPLLAQP